MNLFVLNPEVQTYLHQNINTDIRAFSLMKSPFPEVNAAELAQQLKGIQLAQKKFPFLLSQIIYYPPSENIEQASSEFTANYKAKLVHGKILIDLTGGMGLDDWAFSREIETIYHVERNKSLSEISQINSKQLKIKNIHYFTGNYEVFFEENKAIKADWLYIDPSRRINGNRKFLIEDLEPNISKHLEFYFSKTDKILVKLSPMLNLKEAINEFSNLSGIHLVAVRNELKDILLVLDKNYNSGNPQFYGVNLNSIQPDFSLILSEEENAKVSYNPIKTYIYEPNVCLMKSGCYQWISSKFALDKIHPNTHLYTSDHIIEDFPGKIFLVKEFIQNPKKLEKLKYHVLSKNYPVSVEDLRKKYKLANGDEASLLFTTDLEGKKIVLMKDISLQ